MMMISMMMGTNIITMIIECADQYYLDAITLLLLLLLLLTTRLLDHFTKLLTTVETLDHHVEHQLTAVDDHIKNLLNKISEREDKSEGRIAELESIVKKVLDRWIDR